MWNVEAQKMLPRPKPMSGAGERGSLSFHVSSSFSLYPTHICVTSSMVGGGGEKRASLMTIDWRTHPVTMTNDLHLLNGPSW
jgi:hypothetical protein